MRSLERVRARGVEGALRARPSVRCLALWLAAGALAGRPRAAGAQSVGGEGVAPGASHAIASDADAARLNPGSIALLRTWSARATHVSDLRGAPSQLDLTTIAYATPLPFGLAAATSVAWSRLHGEDGRTRHLVSVDASLGATLLRGLALGARVRVAATDPQTRGGASPEDQRTAVLDGAVSLDLGVVWRPFPALALSLAALNLAGPSAPSAGVDRTLVAGVGLRPAGTDAITLGVDGAYTQHGTGWVRTALRVPVPYVGSLRADAAVDLAPTSTLETLPWRLGVGLELAWGTYTLGGGALVAGTGTGVSPAGFSVSAGVSGVRASAGIPERSVLVSVPLEEAPGARSFARLLLRLERLRADPSVRGVFLSLRGDIGGLAQAEELREALARWTSTGRTVHCHLFEPTGSAYVSCAGAQRITLDPAGTVRAAGVRTSRYFLGDALASLGLRTEFVRIGAWKSAPEQFTRRGSTPEARAQEDQLLDDTYAALRALWSSGRGLTDARARELIESGPYVAAEALTRGMVDALEPRDLAQAQAARACGCAAVSLREFVPRAARAWASGPAVALVHVDGDIVSGESRTIPLVGMRLTGDRTLVATLDGLAANDRIRAVVLRIDSGGGDAIASELLWRAVARLAQRKVVLASVGRASASGAYYLMAPAREVFADRASLVGSIGIFFGKVDLSGLLTRLDVGLELSRRGPRADMDSLYRPFTDDERAVVARGIQSFYQRFVERVARGRHMTPAAVNAVGEGRVFLGDRAREAHLTDRTGGLLVALDRARELAGLSLDAEVLDATVESTSVLDTVLSLAGITAATPGPAANESTAIEREARELAAENTGLSLTGVLGNDELSTALRWVLSVALTSSQGRMLALTEWPLAAP